MGGERTHTHTYLPSSSAGDSGRTCSTNIPSAIIPAPLRIFPVTSDRPMFWSRSKGYSNGDPLPTA